MSTEVAKQFASYGALGLITLVVLWAYFRQWRESRQDRQIAATALEKLNQDYLTRLEAQERAHREEIKALLDRYIGKAETWMEKYLERKDADTEVIESIREVLQRYLAPRGGG